MNYMAEHIYKTIFFLDKEFRGFLVDEMHGKLLKWLRILGYYSEDMSILLQNRKEFEDKRELNWFIFDYTQNHKLILLSSNSSLTEAVSNSFFLDLRDFKENLRIIGKFFSLNYDFDLNHSFCPVCGFDLETILNKEDIKENIPPFTYKQQNEFWRCQNQDCRKIYWKGSHVDDFKTTFDYIVK